MVALVLTSIIVFIDIIIKQNTSLSRYLALKHLHYRESPRLLVLLVFTRRFRVGSLRLFVREIPDKLRVEDHCFVEGVVRGGGRLTLLGLLRLL